MIAGAVRTFTGGWKYPSHEIPFVTFQTTGNHWFPDESACPTIQPQMLTSTRRREPAARFGVAQGGGTMIITPTRHGDFFSAAEVARGANPNWVTGMAY